MLYPGLPHLNTRLDGCMDGVVVGAAALVLYVIGGGVNDLWEAVSAGLADLARWVLEAVGAVSRMAP
jgi:hypothetical protein